jgi:arginine exporter protein ArgO
MAAEAANSKQIKWAVLLAITGLLFNPVIPFHLYPESWRLLDGLVTLMMLLFAVYYAPDRESD